MQQPSLGTTLVGESGDRYVIERRIGQGGTACVYEVMASSGTRYAAKILSDHRFPVDDAMRKRFQREIKQLAQVEHPNVLRYHDRGTFDEEPMLIIELAKSSLYDCLESWHGPLPLPVALGWLEQTFAGVAALHHQGLVHRDLSPKNLMLRDDGTLAVGDFGTVRHLDDATMTQEQLGIGSLIYISEQQFDNAHQAEPRDDVFSLGQIAWQLLAGRRPVGNVPPIGTVRPSLPEGLGDFVESARDNNPARRPADAEVALATLRDIITADRNPRLLGLGAGPAAATVRVIGERQQMELASAAQDEDLRVPARALERLVDALGALRLEATGFKSPRPAPPELPLKLSSELYSVLTNGTLRFHYDVIASEQDGWLLQIENTITGRTAEVAHSGVISTPGANLDLALVELERLVSLTPTARDRLLAPVTARAFLVGRPCPDCGEPLELHRRPASGRFGGPGLFQAARCANDDPPEPFRCCVCGERFRRVTDWDEWGQYDSTGCECRSSLDVEFNDSPWREGPAMTVEDVPEVFG